MSGLGGRVPWAPLLPTPLFKYTSLPRFLFLPPFFFPSLTGLP